MSSAYGSSPKKKRAATGASTIGTINLSATNSRPVSKPSNPAETSIASAFSTCRANAGRETSASKFPTNGRSAR